MKTAIFHGNRSFLRAVLLLSVLTRSLEAFLGPRTLIIPRSQSVNAARDMVGWQWELHRYNQDSNYWVFAFTPEYTRTFHSENLIGQLFGRRCFTITGSDVPYRKPTDLLADYFELPRDYQSTITICPFISQYVGDFNFYVGLDGITQGLFFLIHFPVVSSKWDIRLEECIADRGSDFHPAGYFSDSRIDRPNLLFSMREYLAGHRTIGDVKQPLLYQKVIGLTGRNVVTRLSDVQSAIGYDFARGESYHAGIEMRISAPAGNRPNPRYLFDPVVGNGHHWELGAGITTHYQFWEDDRHAVLIYLDANITHLFGAESKRSFNLRGRCPGSRYMMLQEIADGSIDLFTYGDYPSPAQYTRQLVPAINVLTLCVDTSFEVQGDVALKLAWYRDEMSVDIGYDFWGRSHEKMKSSPCFEQNRYVLKGDAQVYGFDEYNYNAYGPAIPLSVSQNCATIFAGQGAGNFVPGFAFANENADNPTPAFGPDGILMQLDNADAQALNIVQLPVQTSEPTLFLTNCDLDLDSVLIPTSLTSKVFAHISNTWRSNTADPFLGLGVEIEWAHGSSDRGGISQWGIWVKTGLSY